MPFYIDKTSQGAKAALGAAQGYMQTQADLEQRAAEVEARERDFDIAAQKARSVAEYQRQKLDLDQQQQAGVDQRFRAQLYGRPEVQRAFQYLADKPDALESLQAMDPGEEGGAFWIGVGDANRAQDEADQQRALKRLQKLQEAGVVPEGWAEEKLQSGASIEELNEEAGKLADEHLEQKRIAGAAQRKSELMKSRLALGQAAGEADPGAWSAAQTIADEYAQRAEIDPEDDKLGELAFEFERAMASPELAEHMSGLEQEVEMLRRVADPEKVALLLAGGPTAAPTGAPSREMLGGQGAPAPESGGVDWPEVAMMASHPFGAVAPLVNKAVNALGGEEAPVDIPLESVEGASKAKRVRAYTTAAALMQKHAEDPAAFAEALRLEGIKLDEALKELLRNPPKPKGEPAKGGPMTQALGGAL